MKAYKWILMIMVGGMFLSINEAFSQCAPKRRPHRKKELVFIQPESKVVTSTPGTIEPLHEDRKIKEVKNKRRRRGSKD